MKSKLLKGFKTQKEKESNQKYFLEHKFIFDTIVTTLQEELRLLDKESCSSKRYDDQSWTYRQADYNGSKRTYEEIINLLMIGETNG